MDDLTERARALLAELGLTDGYPGDIRAATRALKSEREAAAAEARRTACEAVCYGCKTGQELVEDRGTLMHRHPDTGKLYQICYAADIHRLASPPAPQEEPR